MSLVTQIIFLAVFGAAGFGVGEMLVGGSWIARVIGTVAGLLAGFAIRDFINENLGSLEDEGPRDPPPD
jgi:outer membrane lipoprotein SlyB